MWLVIAARCLLSYGVEAWDVRSGTFANKGPCSIIGYCFWLCSIQTRVPGLSGCWVLFCLNQPDWILATNNPDRYNGLNQFRRMAPPWWGTESAMICDWHGHSRPPPWATKCQISLMVTKGDRAWRLGLSTVTRSLDAVSIEHGLLTSGVYLL